MVLNNQTIDLETGDREVANTLDLLNRDSLTFHSMKMVCKPTTR